MHTKRLEHGPPDRTLTVNRRAVLVPIVADSPIQVCPVRTATRDAVRRVAGAARQFYGGAGDARYG